MAANRLFARFNLPGLLGMIGVGIVLGPHGLGLLDTSILDNAGDIRMIALLVILLRAGLGLEKDLLKRVGAIAAKMSAIPCLLEGFTITGVAHWLLGLPLAEAGMLGFIVAATTPAVIVPAMLRLKEERLGMEAGVPIIVLAGASGMMIALSGSHLTSSERLFTAIAYLPKATVQAAIGGIPLAMGIASGEIILAIAVLAVVITASLGAIAIPATAPRLLKQDSASQPEGEHEAALQ